MNDFEMLIEKNYKLSHEANQRANYNEQYSRKNNVKIMNITEEGGETEQKLVTSVTDILKTRADVDLKPEDITAIHRIPTKKGGIKPVLLKLRNNNAKSNIMRKRKEMKSSGYTGRRCNQIEPGTDQ